MTFYQRNGIFKKQALSGERLKIHLELTTYEIEYYMEVYGIKTEAETISFLIENDKDFINVYELGRCLGDLEIKHVGGFTERVRIVAELK